jgi:hypothetical protein
MKLRKRPAEVLVRASVLTDAAEGHSYATEQRDRIFGASTSASPPSTRWNAYAFEPDGVEGAALALAARRIRFQHEQLATFIQRADRDSGAVSKAAEPEARRQSRDGTGGLGDWCCGANRGERRSSRRGKFGRPVLLAAEGTPPMTTEDVTASIEELS